MSAAEPIRLPLGSPELARALDEGVLAINGVSTPVVATAIDATTATLSPVDATTDRPSSAALWWRAIRPISLTATGTPALATLLFGALAGWLINFTIAIPAMLGALLLQIAVNLINDVEDHRRLIDLPGGPGGAGIIQRGWLRPRTIERAALLALALGIGCGVPALLRAPLPIAIIGALGVLGAFGYSGKPFGFKYRALGDLAVLALCGPGMTLGMGYAAFGQVGPELWLGLWLIGGTLGLFAVGLLHANNLEDRELDQGRGARTVATLLGDRASRVYFAALYVVALALPIVGVATGTLPKPTLAVSLLGALLVAPLVRDVLQARPTTGLPSRARAAQAHLAVGVVFALSLFVSRWF